MITAVNLHVAVLAGALDDARALATAKRGAFRRLSGAEELTGMAAGGVVTLLTEIRPGGDEQLLVIGTVRLVAVQTAVTNRGVFPNERPSTLGMAGVTDVID